MYYRFVIGSASAEEAMIGFTIQARTESEAIARAQTVVDNLQVDNDLAHYPGDIGNRYAGGINAQDISIYAGNTLRVTADHIEDTWTEEDQQQFLESCAKNATRTGNCQKETLLHDLRQASFYFQTQASKHYSRGNEATHAKFSILFEAINSATELIAAQIAAGDVHLETP